MVRLGTFIFAIFSFLVQADVTISEATVRVLPPGVPNTSAYFTIANESQENITLVGAKSEIANTLELHNHVVVGEVMKMQKQEKVVVPAGETVTFAPGGLHVMLFGLKSSLSEKQKVEISLIAETGKAYPFVATAVMPGSHSHHNHH